MANFDELDAEKRQQIIRDYLLNKEAEKVQDVGPSLEDQKSDLAWQEIAQRAAYAGQDKSQDIQNAFNQKRQSLDTDYAAGLKAKRDARRQQFSDVMDVEKLEQQKEQNEQARLDRIQREEAARQEKALDRNARFDLAERERQIKAEEKKAASDQKKADGVVEVENRARNITESIDLLKDIVSEYGTQEMFGHEEGRMNKLLEDIATDMSKLNDPQSVARPQEVEAMKKVLFKPGFWQTENTALTSLEEAKKDVERRKQIAYDVRGLKAPQTQPQRPQEFGGVDKEAVTWATANFNSKDPIIKNQAAEILRVNGIINSSVGAR